MKTADEIMREEFCQDIFDKLDKTEIQYIKDAMKQIASLAFGEGYRRGWFRGTELESGTQTEKQFIDSLFNN